MQILDNVNITNKIYRNTFDLKYLTIVNAVENINKYFSNQGINPLFYKTEYQSLTETEQFNKGRKSVGLFFARFFRMYMDLI